MIDLESILAPTVRVIQSVGLHKVAGAMQGLEEVAMPQAVQIIGARAFVRRKTARLISEGLASLAAVEVQEVSPETAATLRRVTRGR